MNTPNTPRILILILILILLAECYAVRPYGFDFVVVRTVRRNIGDRRLSWTEARFLIFFPACWTKPCWLPPVSTLGYDVKTFDDAPETLSTSMLTRCSMVER